MEEALALRQKYVFVAVGTVEDKVPHDGFGLTPLKTTLTAESVFENDKVPIAATNHAFEMVDGVMHVYDNAEKENTLMQVRAPSSPSESDLCVTSSSVESDIRVPSSPAESVKPSGSLLTLSGPAPDPL